jgi:ribonuclease HII
MDEAGMGPLAGPVTAAVVVLHPRCRLPGVKDSKKMTDESREALVDSIYEGALFYKIAIRTHEDIDRDGISKCWLDMMMELASAAHVKYPSNTIIVDGNRMVTGLPYVRPIVKADDKFLAVSAASVLAKYTQCLWMDDYHAEYPIYGFNRHRGYHTAVHVKRLEAHGPCPIHRKSFKPIQRLLST